MLGSQQFCVRWNSYQTNLQDVFPKLLNSEHFVDVTLACEAQMIKCHKVVLSACSTYFEQLLVQNPCQHPIIFMKDMKHWEVQALVDFMYKGEVNVSQEEISTLLKAAEALQIRGLCGADRQQDSNAVSLPPETTLSDSGGRETPPAKRRKFPEQQPERREKQQPSAPTPKSTNTTPGPSVTSTPTSSSNDLAAVLGVPGPITASVTSAPFRETERNNSSKETHSDEVVERSNIKREHPDQDESSYFDNDGEYDSFDVQDDSNSMNPDVSMPSSPMDQAGPSGVSGMQGSDKSTAGDVKLDLNYGGFNLGNDVSMISSGRMMSNADMQQYLRMLNVRQVRQYSQENLDQAVEDMIAGRFKSVRSCARHYGVPLTTLHYRIKNRIKGSAVGESSPSSLARAWQHLEHLLGSTARRGRPQRDDPSLKAAAHLVMDRSYTLRQAALQFQIPPTTLRNYMKRTGMLRLPLKRGRPVSSGSSYHFYSEPFRMPGNFMNPAYPRPNAPQYQMHQQQQQQYQQQYQHQQHQQHQQQQAQHQHQQHPQQIQQQHSQQHPVQHIPHHHPQPTTHVQQQQQFQHPHPQTQHVLPQAQPVPPQRQYGFNNEFSPEFNDFGSEFCDIQELRPPKLEVSRTPPVEIDLDSEPDQEVARNVASNKVQDVPPTEAVEGDEEDQDEEVEDEEEEEEEEVSTAGVSNSGSVVAVAGKASNERATGTGGEAVDDDSDSESDSDESEADQDQPDRPPL